MPARQQPQKNANLSGYTTPTPKAGDPDDEPISPPVAEDAEPAPRPASGDDDAAGRAPEPPPPAPKDSLPENDKVRAQISARFRARRNEETREFDGDLSKPENLLGDMAAPPAPEEGAGEPAAAAGDPAAAEPGTEPQTPAKPDKITLVVNGKSLRRTEEEVARLADLTVEEVRENPQRAIRFAQRELATSQNLDQSRTAFRRDPPAQDDPGARPARPAPDAERHESGDDARGQPSGGVSDTSDIDDATKLIEDIQIGDPKELAPRLVEFIEKKSKKTSASVVEASQGDQLISRDRESTAAALKGFMDDHAELAGKKSVASAVAAALIDEYREDLIGAMVKEGTDPDEAEEIVLNAAPHEVATAHQRRRVHGDPNVRQIDKTVIERAYNRVVAEFGGTPKPSPTPQPRQEFQQQRQQRKESLPPQPRSASVRPGAAPQPAAQPLSRSDAVAQIRKMRGQK